VTRHELAVLVYTRLGEHHGQKLTKKLTLKIVKTVFVLISECILRGEIVSVEKFGTLKPRAYTSRRSWSHTQKKLIDSRPYLKVDFILSHGLKESAKKLLIKKGGPDG